MPNNKGNIMLRAIAIFCLGAAPLALQADEPAALYVFPAGGQRGTTVDARIGGMNLRDECPLHWHGSGVTAPQTIRRAQTTWFEGPLIRPPDSQQAENYPTDYALPLVIAADAEPGVRRWRVSTSQGVTPAGRFVVGEDPEIVEQETDGAPLPVEVKLPVTINGRIFPREDVDEWSFTARRGQTIRCEVNAARLGSPLDARLEVVDALGRVLALGSDHFGNDPLLAFTVPADGAYRVRIYDTAYGGLQTYVYRLTLSDKPHILSIYPLGGRRGTSDKFELLGINVPRESQTLAIPEGAGEQFATRFALPGGLTNPVVLETSDYEERLAAEPGETPPLLRAPMVANGRIAAPGEIDTWSLAARKGEPLDLEVRAGRLGSPLDSVLTIADAAGKTVAENDDLSGAESDSWLRWTPQADGEYQVRVADRSPRRGGREFGYRLYVVPAAPQDFRLTLPIDALTVLRAGTAKLKVKAERSGGFNDAIALEVAGLPSGVTVGNPQIAKGRSDVDLAFTAAGDAPIEMAEVEIRGRAKIGDHEVAHAAVTASAVGEEPFQRLTLAVGMPTPFRSVASFGLPFAPRGSVFLKHFKIERNGYVGPLEVMFAEKQARHLQGVQGGKFTISAGVDEFDYPIYLPPWMELGRTSRSHVTLVGTVDDGAGRKHLVSYTSAHQNEQLSLIIAPGRLNISLAPDSLAMTVDKPAEVRVRLDRDGGLDGPVRVELIAPKHIQGLTAEPLIVAAGESEAVLKLRFTADAGPFNMPLVVRATHGTGDARHVAEMPLEIVE
jgi:hypothetical protein